MVPPKPPTSSDDSDDCAGTLVGGRWAPRSGALSLTPCRRIRPHGGREKYCHNGGMAFAHHHGGGLPGGPKMAIMAPSGGPLKTAVLQGKSRRVRGSVPFGGSNGLVCLEQRREVLPQGGIALAPHHGVGLPGSDKAMMAPPRGPQKRLLCRGKSVGVHDPRPLGAGMDTSACREKCRRVRGSAPFGCAHELEWLADRLEPVTELIEHA
jgi:hypothetical protein